MDISSNPWVITAADVATVAVIVWPLGTIIKDLQIEFTGYSNVTDQATVLQANGKALAFLQGAADKETVRTGILRGYFNGVQVPVNGITAGSTGIIRIFHP